MARHDILLTIENDRTTTREDPIEKSSQQQQSDSQTVTDSGSSSSSSIEIYHERQSRQLCALHALNNLFQDPRAFDKHGLDMICKTLAPESKIFNPHRSAFGLGKLDTEY